MSALVRCHRVHKVREDWRCLLCDGRWGVALALPPVLEEQPCRTRESDGG